MDLEKGDHVSPEKNAVRVGNERVLEIVKLLVWRVGS